MAIPHVQIREAAQRLDRSAYTIRRWYRQGLLAGRQVGRRIEIREDIIAAVEAGGSLPLPREVMHRLPLDDGDGFIAESGPELKEVTLVD